MNADLFRSPNFICANSFLKQNLDLLNISFHLSRISSEKEKSFIYYQEKKKKRRKFAKTTNQEVKLVLIDHLFPLKVVTYTVLYEKKKNQKADVSVRIQQLNYSQCLFSYGIILKNNNVSWPTQHIKCR